MIIFSDALSPTTQMAERLLRAWEKTMAGERLAIVALRWKALYLSVELGRHTTRCLSDKGRANFLARLMSAHFSSTPRLTDVTARHRAA
jgi:hypothetical protein